MWVYIVCFEVQLNVTYPDAYYYKTQIKSNSVILKVPLTPCLLVAVVNNLGEATPPVLPVAPPPEPRQLTVEEQGRLLEEEEKHLRELRIFLRDCTGKLLAERKFKAFCKPVDLEEVGDVGYLHLLSVGLCSVVFSCMVVTTSRSGPIKHGLITCILFSCVVPL